MKSKKLKKSIVAVCACCAILATGMMSVSATWTYDTTTLPRDVSYVLGASRQGYQCKFSGKNDVSSERNVEFGYYMKDSNRTTNLYKKAIAPGYNPETLQTQKFPDIHSFYVDMDVLLNFKNCYATAQTCIDDGVVNS